MNEPRPVLRRCVACRQLLDRQQLWRVIRDHKDGVLLDKEWVDPPISVPVRTVWRKRRRKRLQKALRCQVPDVVLATLLERLRHWGTKDPLGKLNTGHTKRAATEAHLCPARPETPTE